MNLRSLPLLSRIVLFLATAMPLARDACAQAAGFVSCEPGINGVVTCPCANPPSGLGRGCDNSASTGGAALTATGTPSLTSDNVLFMATSIGTTGPTCSAPTGNVLSVLYQGSSSIPGGVVWGDGVLCCGPTYYILSVQTSNNGTLFFPLPGTSAVSSTAIAAGDVGLMAGSQRCYFVAYRDACPAFCPPSVRQKTNSYVITWQP